MKKKKPFICFVHIERAGGTTLHHIFQNNFSCSYLVLYPRYGMSSKYGYEFSVEQLKKTTNILPFINGIGGHTTRAYLNYEKVIKNRNIYYITFLRDPIKRYISHFNFQLYRKKINWSIEEFLEREEFKNFQTTRIAGACNLEKAKNILDFKINFLGLTEYFDESLLLLKNELINFDIGYKKYNEIKERDKNTFDSFPKNIQKSILKNNEMDIELYKHGLMKFNKKLDSLENIQEKLEAFKRDNKNYIPSRIRKTTSTLFKGFNRYILEPYISRNTL